MAANCGAYFKFCSVLLFFLIGLSGVVITSLRKNERVTLLFVGLYHVCCMSKFAYSSVWCHW